METEKYFRPFGVMLRGNFVKIEQLCVSTYNMINKGLLRYDFFFFMLTLYNCHDLCCSCIHVISFKEASGRFSFLGNL